MSNENSYLARAKVFISHNHKDKDMARGISAELVLAGHEVWLDEWEMVPGDSLVEKISDGIVEAAYLLVLLSEASVNSNWVKRELETALARQLKAKGITVVPCMLEDCELPVFLEPIMYADFRESFEEGIEQLLPAIKMIDLRETGRLKEGEEAWIHDHVFDWQLARTDEEQTFFEITIISTYVTENFSTLFKFRVETTDELAERFLQTPDELKFIHLFYFMSVVTNNIRKQQSKTQREDVGIRLHYNEAYDKTFEYKDVSGKKLGNITIFGRRLGDVRDNDMIYFYGELVVKLIENFVEHGRGRVSPETIVGFEKWRKDNPF